MLKAKSHVQVDGLMMLVTMIAVCFIASLLSQAIAAQSLSPGSLDPTFGNGGIISRSIGTPSIARAVAIQSDGKIVETGWYATRFGLIRYNANGSPDTSFGTNGVVSTNINGWAFAEALAIQTDGRIVVAGSSRYGQKWVFAIARYLNNGSLDTSLGGTGIVTTAIPRIGNNLYDSLAYGVAVQLDGKIVVIGDSCFWMDDGGDGYCTDYSFVTVRYNPDGTLDPIFGNGGIASQSGIPFNRSVAIQPDQKIVVAGSESGVVRYNADGSRDMSFGIQGAADVNGTTDMAIQADGKIVLSTRAYQAGGQVFGVTRINNNGTRDSTFGSGGVVITPGGGVYGSMSHSLAIQSDGRIVVAGTGYDPNVDWRYVIRRYNPNGTLDHSYGTDGLVRVQVGGLHNEGFAVAVDAFGRAVVAGCAFSDSGWGLIRLNGGGIAPSSPATFDFDGDGRTDVSAFRPTDGVWYLDRSTAGPVGFQWGSPTDQITPADYDADGKTDVAVYRPAERRWYILESSTLTVSTVSWGVETDIPTPADYDNDGRADISLFRPSDGTWWIGLEVRQFGQNGDHPVVGDYDADGHADIAVFRPSTGVWYINRSTAGLIGYQFGVSTDKVAPADYDADGRTDIAVYRPSEGKWYIANSGSPTYPVFQFGIATDIPVPGDYDGDGRADIAIFRPSDGNWWINRTTSGLIVQQFGLANDKPVPAAYLP